MKPFALTTGLLVSAAFANAQYFSTGWTPGQPIAPEPTDAAKAYVHDSTARRQPSPGFFNSLLSSKPVESFFSKYGVNITKTLEPIELWDERIQLITDDNYRDIIVNEVLTEEEEKERTWVIAITVTAASPTQETVSKMMDQVFDAAYNETVVADDLPNVRWGRIDYLNVTYLTTKWNVWTAPYILILRNRGQELRFYKGQNLRLRADALRGFLKSEDWKHTPAWSSAFAPGGDREFILDAFATWMTKIYNQTSKMPRWLLFIISGGIASILLNLMHRSSTPNNSRVPVQTAKTTIPAPDTGKSNTASSNSDGEKLKKRKRH
ncbi:hypothetical protein AX17_002077 [Amanita inopinata Kibby_2008]|nr:hypothetical protein AX17_002077 [Amanita inopinata Kibby_2008]